jgi:hypothetical protein
MPEPRAIRIRLLAAAVMAPARMAGHEAADTGDSLGRFTVSVIPLVG